MSDKERTLTFTGHLEELRNRLIVCIVAWVVCTAIAFPLAKPAIGLLTKPLALATRPENPPRVVLSFSQETPSESGEFRLTARFENVTSGTKALDQIQVDLELPTGESRSLGEGARTGSNFYYTHLLDPLMLIFKTALILGFILALPVWVHQIWRFVSPGMKASEKAVVRPLFFLSVLLFPCGVVFAYFLLIMIIRFFMGINIPDLAPLLDYFKFAPFAMRFMVAFGIVFELPVAILLLARLGVVTPQMLRQFRGYSYIVIAVLSMMMTPAEPVSMIVMMLPLFGLYELSIWLSYMARRSGGSAWEDYS